GACPLEERDRLVGFLLPHIGNAAVVEGLNVIRLLGQRLTQEVEGLVPLALLDRQRGLGHVDVGVAQLGRRRRRGYHPRGRHQRQSGQPARYSSTNRTHEVALLPSDVPGRCTPQPASFTSTVLRCTPSCRAARLTFHCARSSVRRTYWRLN